MNTSAPSRSGVMLIVVVGFAAMLLAVSWSFFARMRSDAQDSESVVQEAQARMMLYAGLNYVQEASRLGWHDPDSPAYAASGVMAEGFGWTDLRDGSAGPKDQDGNPVWTDPSVFPAPGGRAARFPMYVMQQAPFAVKPKRVHNPLTVLDSGGWDAPAHDNVDYDMPNLPLEPVSARWSFGDGDAFDQQADFLLGNQAPHSDSQGLAWFRVYREDERDHNGVDDPGYDDPAYDVPGLVLSGHHGIFVITCGSGGTLGFRDWNEVELTSGGDLPFDRVTFENLRGQERILWYRVEWSATILPATYGNVVDAPGSPAAVEQKAWSAIGGIGRFSSGNQLTLFRGSAPLSRNKPTEGGSVAPNPVGTIEWVMRLERPPIRW